MYKLKWTTIVALFAVVAGGCGSRSEMLYPVTGKVTFRGKAVAAGMMRFCNPQAGIDMTAEIRPDGTYEAMRAHGAGLPEGTYQVAVMPPRLPAVMGPMKEIPKPPECRDIPAKYRQPSTSRLAMTVKTDANHFDVDMQP